MTPNLFCIVNGYFYTIFSQLVKNNIAEFDYEAVGRRIGHSPGLLCMGFPERKFPNRNSSALLRMAQ
jgi:hypothetical protein